MAGISVSIPTINGQAIGDPQRSDLFDLRLPLINGARTPMVESVDSANPFEAIQIQSEAIGGRHRYIAVGADSDPLVITLYHECGLKDTPGNFALKYIKAWQALVRNADGTVNLPKSSSSIGGYLYDIYYDLLNPDKKVGYTITYKNCFPRLVSPLATRYSDKNQRTRIQVTFSVERIYPGQDTASTGTLSFLGNKDMFSTVGSTSSPNTQDNPPVLSI